MRADSAGGAATAEGCGQSLHVAVVYDTSGVRHVAAAASRAGLAESLADYVRRHATDQLWPGDARRLRRLLAAGRSEEAVELYFASVGERWDEERLVIRAVAVSRAQSAAASPRAARRPDRNASAASRE